MSVAREVVRGRPRPRRARRAPDRRLGLLDLVLVVGVVAVVGSRTPLGGLGWYAVERLRGHAADLPSLTAYFDGGAAAPPAALPWLPPEPAPLPDGAVPEPWRTAARAALADPPEAVEARLAGEDALVWLDRAHRDRADVEAALEELAIGADLRDRAIARARAAGDHDPERYAAHRRYLPGAAQRDADRVVQATLGLATALDLEWPLRSDHRVTSPYGHRIHPVLRTRRFHNGVDLAVPVGTPVHAAQAGTVVVVGQDDISGVHVVLDHGNGVRTAYAHLSRAHVVRGQEVGRGEVLALSGNTGRSTGPHLHYVVRIAGETTDPERFRRVDRG